MLTRDRVETFPSWTRGRISRRDAANRADEYIAEMHTAGRPGCG